MAKSKSIEKQRIEKIRSLRSHSVSTTSLVDGIRNGDRTALARAITLIESTQMSDADKAEALVTSCAKQGSNSIRIGITGVPGVGKSTFIESFGLYLAGLGKKIAVLAVDPSSSISKGSILGDKTRMEQLAKHPSAFIRPSPANDALGGVSRKTRETIVLCEAAGFDVILVETVGVGQSETEVHGMVDFFLLLKLAGAGDGLQGIKRGIIEMADALIINKDDGENRKLVESAILEFTNALHLYPPKESGWTPKVSRCSAIEHTGMDSIWALISEFLALTKGNGHFETHRNAQKQQWFRRAIENQLHRRFYADPVIAERIEQLEGEINENETTPFAAAQKLLALVDMF
ncbi:MAG: methylmalonyl Co-A mutase-associated GTPase MeaB [Flavobacteriaceae bacterium]|nr:methylmalonyl Co-A mutase-associated GTPase MeaB [Flavobacteriaceae bacterium]